MFFGGGGGAWLFAGLRGIIFSDRIFTVVLHVFVCLEKKAGQGFVLFVFKPRCGVSFGGGEGYEERRPVANSIGVSFLSHDASDVVGARNVAAACRAVVQHLHVWLLTCGKRILVVLFVREQKRV